MADFKPSVFASEVPLGPMEPLLHGVGRDLENGGDVTRRKLFPRHKSEHLRVGTVQACSRVEDKSVLELIHQRFVRGARWNTRGGHQTSMESSSTRGTAPLVTDLAVRDPVKPDQRRIPRRNSIEPTPHRDEHLCHGIVNEVTRQPSTAEGADRSEVTAV
jgi:hypothetical protein